MTSNSWPPREWMDAVKNLYRQLTHTGVTSQPSPQIQQDKLNYMTLHLTLSQGFHHPKNDVVWHSVEEQLVHVYIPNGSVGKWLIDYQSSMAPTCNIF